MVHIDDGIARGFVAPGEERKALVGTPQHGTQGELDKLIGAWTVQFSPDELMDFLQKNGIPAGAVLTGEGIYNDPQLKHREAVWYMDHPEIGRFGYYTAPFNLSETPAEPKLPPPCLGEHTEYVCTEIMKMSTEEFIQLLNEGVFE